MKKIAIIALAAILAAGCGRNQGASNQAIKVGVIEVGGQSSSYIHTYSGNAVAAKEHMLMASHDGTVSELNIKVGQRVKEGAVMAKMDAPNVMSLNRVNQATLRQARDGYARAKKVYEAGGLTEIKWMEVQTQLEQAEAAAEISNRSVEDLTLKAPFTGTVSQVYVSLGEEVVPGKPIARIMDETQLDVAFGIPENEYSGIEEGGAATVVVPALNNLEVDGKISYIGVNSTNLTHSYIVTVTLKNVPAGLKAGMACKVSLQSDIRSRIVVPAILVKVDDAGRYVWLANNGVVEKRHVEVGGFVGKGVCVTDGLNTGDLVICEGASKVSTGMKVEPQISKVK